MPIPTVYGKLPFVSAEQTCVSPQFRRDNAMYGIVGADNIIYIFLESDRAAARAYFEGLPGFTSWVELDASTSMVAAPVPVSNSPIWRTTPVGSNLLVNLNFNNSLFNSNNGDYLFLGYSYNSWRWSGTLPGAAFPSEISIFTDATISSVAYIAGYGYYHNFNAGGASPLMNIAQNKSARIETIPGSVVVANPVNFIYTVKSITP